MYFIDYFINILIFKEISENIQEFKKHDNGILIILKDFDYKVIEKIKSLQEKKYVPEQKAWLVGKQHEKELRNHFVLPHFLITE